VPQTSCVRAVRSDSYIDLGSTFGPLVRGRFDPTSRFVAGDWLRAWHTPEGPVTTRVAARAGDGEIEIEAWGDGSAWALDHADDILGTDVCGPVFEPHDPLLRRLARQYDGMRLTRLRAVYDVAIATVLEQRVTSIEARRTWARLVRVHGDLAPGPLALCIAPAPAVLAGVADHERHDLGVETRRGETLARVAREVVTLDAAAALDDDTLAKRLRSINGMGPWTNAHVLHAAQGDPDAVPIGDWHLPSNVAFALRGERRADDTRMLELLEPFRPHRAWAWRLIVAGTPLPPRRVPRARIPDLIRAERARRR
jgi:endonuclease III